MEALNTLTDIVNSLAFKLLYIVLLATIEWSSPELQPAKVFHLTGRILGEKASLSSMPVAQAIAYFLSIEDLEKVAKRRARLAAKAIVSFDIQILDEKGLTTSYDSLESVEVAYQFDSIARPTCNYQGI